MITATKTLLDKALREYDVVMAELNRPEEDLVMIAACELIKKSISDFLEAYLNERGVHVKDKEDILALQKQCESFDKSFLDLDYSSIVCLSEETSMAYTNMLEDSQLIRYVDTLKKTKEWVIELI